MELRLRFDEIEMINYTTTTRTKKKIFTNGKKIRFLPVLKGFDLTLFRRFHAVSFGVAICFPSDFVGF